MARDKEEERFRIKGVEEHILRIEKGREKAGGLGGTNSPSRERNTTRPWKGGTQGGGRSLLSPPSSLVQDWGNLSRTWRKEE